MNEEEKLEAEMDAEVDDIVGDAEDTEDAEDVKDAEDNNEEE